MTAPRWSILAFCLLLIAPEPAGARTGGVLLVSKGRPVSRIVLSATATRADSEAALLLQKYLRLMSGATLPIGAEEPTGALSAVRIGSAGSNGGFPGTVKWDTLEEDGFTICTAGKDLLVAGGTGKGSLYGVATLLESVLGCRKFSPTVEAIPRRTTVSIPPVDITQVPSIRFRDAHYTDPEYRAWHKLDTHTDEWGLYVHTFRTLVPPEKYFASHPEYFSRVRAGRIPDAQLCLTNPDLFGIVVEGLKERMRLRPEARYWSVSQNDTFSPCECESCRAVDEREGSPSGAILAFVNRVAGEFPDKTISTLAYQYSRAAPRHLVPRENVNIMLCSIECNRSRPIATDPSSASFRTDVEQWSALTKNILLWDYVVQFRNLVSPFPNLRVLQPNIRYFARHGIRALFQQGSGDLVTEFKDLRTYLIAKLLWDPDVNVDSVMNDFLRGYYGKAAPAIRSYIDRMHDALAASGEELLIYGYPLPSENGYLSPGNMDAYGKAFDRAEKAVKGERELMSRVRTARLPLQFALLEQGKVYGTGARGFYRKGSDGKWHVRPSMMALLDTFVVRCEWAGVTHLEEMGRSPRQYREETMRLLESSMKEHLALFRPITMARRPSAKYHNGEAAALTDGLCGPPDYHLNWVGFEGEDLEGTIDLGTVRTVRRIGVNFLQDINSWIFLPTEVEFALGKEPGRLNTLASVPNPVPQTKGGTVVQPFATTFAAVEARYVRVRAKSLKTCPDWHKGAGGLAWIFADELVVE